VTSGEEVARAVRRMVGRTSHWTAARWEVPVLPDGGSRADLVHALVQEIADMAAAAEGQPCRRVPRLDNDLALPDQLRVVSADLVAAGQEAQLRTAADRITDIARTLDG
jgi:hypothetical protein